MSYIVYISSERIFSLREELHTKGYFFKQVLGVYKGVRETSFAVSAKTLKDLNNLVDIVETHNQEFVGLSKAGRLYYVRSTTLDGTKSLSWQYVGKLRRKIFLTLDYANFVNGLDGCTIYKYGNSRYFVEYTE